MTLQCADHDSKHLKYRREIHGTEAYYAAGLMHLLSSDETILWRQQFQAVKLLM